MLALFSASFLPGVNGSSIQQKTDERRRVSCPHGQKFVRPLRGDTISIFCGSLEISEALKQLVVQLSNEMTGS